MGYGSLWALFAVLWIATIAVGTIIVEHVLLWLVGLLISLF